MATIKLDTKVLLGYVETAGTCGPEKGVAKQAGAKVGSKDEVPAKLAGAKVGVKPTD